jgi:hypothetical protein
MGLMEGKTKSGGCKVFGRSASHFRRRKLIFSEIKAIIESKIKFINFFRVYVWCGRIHYT